MDKITALSGCMIICSIMIDFDVLKHMCKYVLQVDYDQLNIKKENVFDLNCVVYQINGKCVTFKSNTPLYLNNEEGITRTGGSIGDQILAKLRESQYRVP